ncbi:hypothetical protein IMZ21_28205 (plasmid) [Klebsiella michiganensis]|nr:hypothetical protein IMZ21_28205 [Klebsiella michiganensis]
MNKLLIFMALSLSLCLSGCDLGTSKSSWATAKVVKTEMVYGNVLYRIVFYTLPDFDEGNRIFQANLSPLEAVKAEHGQMNIRLRTYSDGKIMVYENIKTFKE